MSQGRRFGLRAGAMLAAVACAFPAAAMPPGSRTPDTTPEARIERVTITASRALNLVCMGSGEPTVLFEAGGGDWSDVWALVQPSIASQATACAYDRAGLGLSDPATGPRTPFAVVEDLHALISSAGLRLPLVLVGHSLGGFDAKLYAALYPADVSALVLIDASEERSWPRSRLWAVENFGAALAARSELSDHRFTSFLVQHYADCAALARLAELTPGSLEYRRCTGSPKPQLGEVARNARQRVEAKAPFQITQASELAWSVYGDDGADGAYEALFRPGVFGDKPVIALTHHDAEVDDPAIRLGEAQNAELNRQTTTLSDRGEHRLVEGSGHYIQLDQPAAVIDAIRSVLEQLSQH